jgi:hypothetical protein
MLLQACLGLDIDATRGELVFDRPVLPASIGRLSIEGLDVATGRLDLVLERHADDIGVHLVRRDGDAVMFVRK